MKLTFFALSALLLALSAALPKGGCPAGCCGSGEFFIVPSAVSREAAGPLCAANGGELAQLTAADMQKASVIAFQCSGPNSESWIDAYEVKPAVGVCLVISTGSAAPGAAINVPKDCQKHLFPMCRTTKCMLKDGPKPCEECPKLGEDCHKPCPKPCPNPCERPCEHKDCDPCDPCDPCDHKNHDHCDRCGHKGCDCHDHDHCDHHGRPDWREDQDGHGGRGDQDERGPGGRDGPGGQGGRGGPGGPGGPGDQDGPDGRGPGGRDRPDGQGGRREQDGPDGRGQGGRGGRDGSDSDDESDHLLLRDSPMADWLIGDQEKACNCPQCTGKPGCICPGCTRPIDMVARVKDGKDKLAQGQTEQNKTTQDQVKKVTPISAKTRQSVAAPA